MSHKIINADKAWENLWEFWNISEYFKSKRGKLKNGNEGRGRTKIYIRIKN